MKQKLIIITSFLSLFFCFLTNVNCQWVQTNGPYGGGVGSLAFNGKDLFASGQGIFHLADSSNSWNVSGLENSRCESIFSNRGYIYTVTGEGHLYRSSDNGITWILVGNGLDQLAKSFVATDSSIIAGTTRGIFLSNDNGLNWKEIDTNLHYNINGLVKIGSNLFAGVDNHVYLSDDQGINWTMTIGYGLPQYGIYTLGVNGTSLFASMYGGIYRSSDNGTYWTVTGSLLTTSDIYTIATIDNNLFAGGANSGVIISTNNGGSWTPMDSGLSPYKYMSVSSFAFNGKSIFVNTDRGVFRSRDIGNSWQEVNTNLRNIRINSLAVKDSTIIAFSSAYVYHSNDGGNIWSTSSSGPYPEGIAVIDDKIFVGTSGAVSTSTDYGVSWTRFIHKGLPISGNMLSFAFSGAKIFVATSDYGVFQSTDAGLNWTGVNNGLTDWHVKSLAINGTNLFAGSNNNGSVFLSTNFGISWDPVTSIGPVNKLVFVDTVLLAHNGKDIFSTSDKGIHWSKVGSGLRSGNVNDFCVSSSNIFASTDSGIYVSIDFGKNWSPINTGLKSLVVLTLKINNGVLYCGTREFGVWRRPLSEMINTNAVEKTPQSKLPIESFPNPFSQSTSIKFSSQDRTLTQVSIHNLLGSEVAQIFYGMLDAGEHSFTWDAHGIPTGMYVCIVKSGGDVKEIPLMLVK